jgi:hypothetical protein
MEGSIRLEKKTSNYLDVMCLVGVLVSLGITAFVFVNAPLSAELAYYGGSIPAVLLLLLSALGILMFWISERLLGTHPTRGQARALVFISGPVTILVCIFFQAFLAVIVLDESGYFR